ncbi:MAG TPA: peptidoglycan DD-metalloendopeptidase family protein [Polyangiaceae bacterium]|jgi:murein DD-endopeptidase MepM/ murein hydrolase activator NlpD|nr:peptidoglycan DD-metalloendopeptidase family protein [Polyangiaceae bacterium]
MKRAPVLTLALALAPIASVGLASVAATRSAAYAAYPGGPAAPSDPAMALAALDRKIADLDSAEQSDKLEIARIGGEIAAAHARVVARGRAFYKMTRAGLMPVGGGFDALVSHAMRVERVRRLVGEELGDEARLRGRAVQLAGELERIARDRVAFASQRSAMDAARLAVQDEARRQAAFDHAFQSSTGGSADYVAVYGADGLSADPNAGGFAAARGKLLFPVAGRAEVVPARREGTTGPGLEMHAPAGAVVRASFAGHVAFADRYGPYGRIVILDHGAHYFTVSGNLDEIDVKIGQDVGAGERVGTVGDDGRGPMLYFEVRHGSQTVPPGPWLGL